MISIELTLNILCKIEVCFEKRAYRLNETMISRLYHESISK